MQIIQLVYQTAYELSKFGISFQSISTVVSSCDVIGQVVTAYRKSSIFRKGRKLKEYHERNYIVISSDLCNRIIMALGKNSCRTHRHFNLYCTTQLVRLGFELKD